MVSQGFVMGVPDEQKSVQTVTRVAGMEPYLVEFNDHNGKKQVSIVLKVKGSDTCFMFNQKIGGSHVATTPYKWFQESLNTFLEEKGVSIDDPASKDGISQV